MSKMNIQFHALPEEIAMLILKSTLHDKIHFVLQGNLPFIAKEIQRESLCADLMSLWKNDTTLNLYLMLQPPLFGATSRLKFLDANQGGVFIDIGRLLPTGLKQSAISVMDGYPATYEVAKKLKNELKKISHGGVTIINEEMGLSKVNKTYRYTAGALELESTGIRMLPFAGGVKMVLGDNVN